MTTIDPPIESSAKITSRSHNIERARLEALLDAAGPNATFRIDQKHGDPRDPREASFIETTITATWTTEPRRPKVNNYRDKVSNIDQQR